MALGCPHSLVGDFHAEPTLFRYRVSNGNFDYGVANGGVAPPLRFPGKELPKRLIGDNPEEPLP